MAHELMSQDGGAEHAGGFLVLRSGQTVKYDYDHRCKSKRLG